MPIFYRGAGVGTWWHVNDARVGGFIPHMPTMPPTLDRVLTHIARGTTTSPFVSLTRSYPVALAYARAGRALPSATVPAYVYEIELAEPLPAGLQLWDPVKEVASHIPTPAADVSYQHDGSQTFLVGLIDAARQHLLNEPCPLPPGAAAPPRAANLTLQLQTLVCALRDAEILTIGPIPAAHVRHRYDVF